MTDRPSAPAIIADPVQPHPVAALLTEEMKARVGAARFEDKRSASFSAEVTAKIDNRRYCPIGVALGDKKLRFPMDWQAAEALGARNTATIRVIRDFMELVDTGQIAAADVYALLGCEPLAAAAAVPGAGDGGTR